MSDDNKMLDLSGVGMDSIRQVITLVEFRERRWGDSRVDDAATKAAVSGTGAKTGAVRGYKSLLGNRRQEYMAVNRAISRAVRTHHARTFAYRNGIRAIANGDLMDYVKAMEEIRCDMDDALKAFERVLPGIIAHVRDDLGSTYDPLQYPSVPEIISRFGFEYSFEPLPSGDNFGLLPEGFAQRLEKDLTARVRTRLQAGLNGLWEDLRKAVAHMATVLGGTSTHWQSSTVNNVRDLIRRISDLDVLGDADYTELCNGIRVLLTTRTAAQIKANPVLRAEIAGHATQLLDVIDQQIFGVAPPPAPVPVPDPAPEASQTHREGPETALDGPFDIDPVPRPAPTPETPPRRSQEATDDPFNFDF